VAQSYDSRLLAGEVRAPADVAIEQVHVEDGAKIGIGTPVLSFDTLELQRRLGVAQNKRQLVLIEGERIQDFATMPRIPKDVTTIEYEVVTEREALLAQNRAEADKADYFKEQVEILRRQHSVGATLKSDLDRVETAYYKQLADHEHISESIRLRDVQSIIARYRHQMSLLKQDIEIKHLLRAIELSTIRGSISGRVRIHVFSIMFVSKDDLLFSVES